MSSSYRPEIEGLRAFAVFAVIGYHFFPSFIPSGYLGVDIFFVISGYVITGSLSNSNKHYKSKLLIDFICVELNELLLLLFYALL